MHESLARHYRPQTFEEVLGQDVVVQTLRNGMLLGRLGSAYLFSGPRGTGKTTTARILAKAINCPNRSSKAEPCNHCTSCKEIQAGRSLDVIEIDGASHRGIEDIRQINETAAYAAASQGYKIYIIDEVHMLTKEAFNALLKTLEEPPSRVLFFFATTEPHKVLPTILSRCQRFHLNRIPEQVIVEKLRYIAKEEKIEVEEEALRMIARLAGGGLRDAESLLDQIFSFQEGNITAATVSTVLGTTPSALFFELDQAASSNDSQVAFKLVEEIYSTGKDIHIFMETLLDHYRALLLLHYQVALPHLLPEELTKLQASKELFTRVECQTIVEMLLEAEQKVKSSPTPKILLEIVLLKIIRIHEKLSLEALVDKLEQLEEKLSRAPSLPAPPKKEPPQVAAKPKEVQTKKVDVKEHRQQAVSPREQIQQYDTLYQFAAVELEGKFERK